MICNQSTVQISRVPQLFAPAAPCIVSKWPAPEAVQNGAKPLLAGLPTFGKFIGRVLRIQSKMKKLSVKRLETQLARAYRRDHSGLSLPGAEGIQTRLTSGSTLQGSGLLGRPEVQKRRICPCDTAMFLLQVLRHSATFALCLVDQYWCRSYFYFLLVD